MTYYRVFVKSKDIFIGHHFTTFAELLDLHGTVLFVLCPKAMFFTLTTLFLVLEPVFSTK